MEKDYPNTVDMLQAILGSIDEAIHAVDHNGFTIFYNRVAAEHDGLEIKDVIGKHVLDVFPSLNRESSTLLKVIATGEAIYNQPQTYQNNKGKVIETVNTTIPIKVNDTIAGAVEIAKDFSKMKLLSEKLIDLQARINKKVKKPKNSDIRGANYRFTDILTASANMERVISAAKKAADTSSSILVYGETGTGKELFVQSIHQASNRKSGPFIAQNCAAMPSTLLESILFGTAKGSFTGAIDRPGLFELAHGGTLFLDEINSMPLDIQASLLRVLEDGVIRRIGGAKDFVVDVRVIAAINESPSECLNAKKLRRDLYYRLNAFMLEIPPLRSRRDDIDLLAHAFLAKYNQKFGKNITGFDSRVRHTFQMYTWPGNVRELEHTVEHAMNLCDSTILKLEHLPSFLHHYDGIKQSDGPYDDIRPLRDALEEMEGELIRKAMECTKGNVQKAAQLLKIPRQTLQYKLKKMQPDC